MFSNERDDATQLEILIDRYGVNVVLDTMSEICYDKAQHVEVQWALNSVADEWQKIGSEIRNLSVRLKRRHLI